MHERICNLVDQIGRLLGSNTDTERSLKHTTVVFAFVNKSEVKLVTITHLFFGIFRDE